MFDLVCSFNMSSWSEACLTSSWATGGVHVTIVAPGIGTAAIRWAGARLPARVEGRRLRDEAKRTSAMSWSCEASPLRSYSILGRAGQLVVQYMIQWFSKSQHYLPPSKRFATRGKASEQPGRQDFMN